MTGRLTGVSTLARGHDTNSFPKVQDRDEEERAPWKTSTTMIPSQKEQQEEEEGEGKERLTRNSDQIAANDDNIDSGF